MKRTISEDMAVPAGVGDPPGGPGAVAVPEAARRPLRELMDDRLLGALLERSRDHAEGLWLTGEESMLESELTAHLGYDRGGRQRAQREHRQVLLGRSRSRKRRENEDGVDAI